MRDRKQCGKENVYCLSGRFLLNTLEKKILGTHCSIICLLLYLISDYSPDKMGVLMSIYLKRHSEAE